jgi:predicted DNA binding CopG/RHH family protein
MPKLDKEEREILEAFERGELKSIPNKTTELKRHREYATATFKKDSRINIRLARRDLDALQKRALSEGIPYQALIASVLHKFADGRLIEKTPNHGLKGTGASLH